MVAVTKDLPPAEVAQFIERQDAVLLVGVDQEGAFSFLSSFPERDVFTVCYHPAFGDGHAQVMGLNVASDALLVQLLSRAAIGLMKKAEAADHEPIG